MSDKIVPDEKAAREMKIVALARKYESEGDIELDDDENVVISEGDENGAYVRMWQWIDFDGTELCKGDAGNHSDCSEGCPVADQEADKS